MGTDVRGFEVAQASPCGAKWSSMSGSACVRTCGMCRARVFEVDGLSRPEVQALVGALRPAFRVRDDGTLLLRDCPVGRHVRARQSRRRAWLLATASVVGFVLGLWWAGRDATLALSDPPEPPQEIVTSHIGFDRNAGRGALRPRELEIPDAWLRAHRQLWWP